jgi:hypothetical protein
MSSESLRWCEISDLGEPERFECLSEALTEAGVKNSFSLIQVSAENFESTLHQAQADFEQIRIGGTLREVLPRLMTRLPSSMISLRSADAFVRGESSVGVEWWPRNFLAEGLTTAIANDLKQIDFTGFVFILGARAETRAVVSSLVRVGFTRFNLTDPNEDRCKVMIDEFRRSYFNVQFHFVPRTMITQLPSVHSIAINFLQEDESEGMIQELAYFNFLRSGGVWLDFPLVTGNPALDAEASSLEAVLLSSARVLAHTDRLWALASLGARIEVELLENRLSLRRKSAALSR